MKTRIVLIAENDNPIPEGYSREEVEDLLIKTWKLIAASLSHGGDHCYIESAELVEEKNMEEKEVVEILEEIINDYKDWDDVDEDDIYIKALRYAIKRMKGE